MQLKKIMYDKDTLKPKLDEMGLKYNLELSPELPVNLLF